MTENVEPAAEATQGALLGDEGLTTAQLAGAKPESAARPVEARAPAVDESRASPLFSESETADLRNRWDAVQTGFVDEPRKSVQDADGLVAAAMKRLAEAFAEERARLESQWDRGGEVNTEDLRQALRRYRSFFGRLLAV